jgi:hypothetical protein
VVGGGGDALQRVAEGVEVDSFEVVEEVAAQADVVGGRGFLVALPPSDCAVGWSLSTLGPWFRPRRGSAAA